MKKDSLSKDRLGNKTSLAKYGSFDDVFANMESTFNRAFGQMRNMFNNAFDLSGVDFGDDDPFSSLQSTSFDEGGTCRVFDRNWFTKGSKFPTVDIAEDDDNVYIEAALAGYEKGDVDIELKDDGILLKAVSKSNNEQEGKNYHFRRMIGKSFSKFINIPVGIERDKISAVMDDKSVLKITMPKIKVEEKPKVSNKIDIK